MELINQSNHIFASIMNVIEQISESEYSEVQKLLGEGSISKHIRHILEFYQELLLGFERGIINYDSRKRSMKLETDLSFVKEFIELLAIEIQKIEQDKEIMIQVSENTENGFIELRSTVFREISYCNEHAVHHLAILQLVFRNVMPTLNLPEAFGVSLATQIFDKSRTRGIIVND